MEKKQKADASSFEKNEIDGTILDVGKNATTLRQKKLSWHSRLTIEITQLCERHNEQVYGKAALEKKRVAEEKRQKTRAAKKAKENTDCQLMVVSTKNIPVSQSARDKDVPAS